MVTIIAPYLKADLGVSDAQIGLLFGLQHADFISHVVSPAEIFSQALRSYQVNYLAFLDRSNEGFSVHYDKTEY